MSTTAIVLAAGESRRMQGMGDKVVMPLAGIPMIVHSVLTMEQESQIKEVVLVTAERLMAEFYNLVDRYNISKVSAIVSGGSARQDSVWLGMCALSSYTTQVIVHDAARPCLEPASLRQVIADATQHGASILAVPVKDTIKLVADQRVTDTPDRSLLWAAQTPQVFDRALLTAAHRAAREQGLDATDDASLVSRLGHEVYVTQGEYSNIKVTTPEDIIFAEAFLSRRRVVDGSRNRL